MISDELLNKFIENPGDYGPSVLDMAKELLMLRPCRHNWNTISLVEAGGRYHYCTLCGAKKVRNEKA